MKQPIFTGTWGNCHIQGIAVDLEKGYLYYSFTTKLVKAKLDGTIIGSVDGIIGHLGCIAFNKEDGKLYGSLEYKNDAIGRGILAALGSNVSIADAFYIAIFDVEKIDRMDMNAEKDGILTTVYLSEVVADYYATADNGHLHRYGCSGIDGITFGPAFGNADSDKRYLYVAYGIYSDLNREDNDHQILLCYDIVDWSIYAQPLCQDSMHKSGPAAPQDKLFIHTGNTTYGIQNLEYDDTEKAFFMAVYPGKKNKFPNFSLFAADATKAPVLSPLVGLNESGMTVPLKPLWRFHEATGIYGSNFPSGSTGLCALGNGRWLISENHVTQSGQCSLLYTYVFDPKYGFVLED